MNDTTAKEIVVIKKYANRRLYNTATSTYVTLENLSQMVKEGTEFNVYDAKSGDDITRSVLTQIIVVEEGKSGQQNLLPISFLRQLIGFYGDNMQWMVPKYLEQSMHMLTKNQDQMRTYFQSSFGGILPFGTTLEEMGKQNLAMFERTMRMFSPFGAGNGGMGNTTTTNTDTAAKTPNASSSSAATSSADEEEPMDMSQAKKASAPVVSPVEEAVPASRVTNISRRSDPMANVPGLTATSFLSPSAAPSSKASPPAVAPPTPTAPSLASAEVAGTASTPMPNVKSATAALAPSADDMQQKISNLQKQLAELAKGRG